MSSFLINNEIHNDDNKETVNKNIKNSCIIEFNFNINNIEEQYNNMTTTWLSYYEDNSIDNFTLVFKGDDDNNIPINYVYRLSKFIKKIKNKRKKDYVKYNKLSQSIVMIKSKYMRALLNLLFTLVSPLSDLYITSTIEQTNMITDNIEKGNTILPETLKDIQHIKSSYDK